MATKKTPGKNGTKADKAAIKDVFGDAPEIEPVPPKKKSKISEQVEMGEDFDTFVALALVESAIQGAKKEHEGRFKDGVALSHYAEAAAEGKKPTSFHAVADEASADFVFGKRAAGFDKAVADILSEHGVPFVTEEKVKEKFTINPLILDDQEKLAQLANAINALNLDYKVIEKQKPVLKYTFDEKTFEGIAKIKDPAVRKELVRQIGQTSIKNPKLEGKDAVGGALHSALEIIRDSKVLDKWVQQQEKAKAAKKDLDDEV